MPATLSSSSTATSGRVEPLRSVKIALLRLALPRMVAVEGLVEDSDVVDSLAVAASLVAVALVVVSEAEVAMVVVDTVLVLKLLEHPFHQTISPISQPMVGRAAKPFTSAT